MHQAGMSRLAREQLPEADRSVISWENRFLV
jgi:hypothetical protein